MIPSVQIRNYRQRQAACTSKRQGLPKITINLRSYQMKILLAGAALAVVMGSIMTHGLYGRILASQERVQQLRAEHNVIATKNMQLLAARAQLTSRTHVLALAEKKLKLFEPEKGQVHRM